jgi:hypothetical protein
MKKINLKKEVFLILFSTLKQETTSELTGLKSRFLKKEKGEENFLKKNKNTKKRKEG